MLLVGKAEKHGQALALLRAQVRAALPVRSRLPWTLVWTSRGCPPPPFFLSHLFPPLIRPCPPLSGRRPKGGWAMEGAGVYQHKSRGGQARDRAGRRTGTPPPSPALTTWSSCDLTTVSVRPTQGLFSSVEAAHGGLRRPEREAAIAAFGGASAVIAAVRWQLCPSAVQ